MRGQNKPFLKNSLCFGKGCTKEITGASLSCVAGGLYLLGDLGRVILSLREVRLLKMAVLAGICLLVLAICPAVRAQGRAGSFVTALEPIY